MTGSWQSYINRIEVPGVGPGTEPKLQANSETVTPTASPTTAMAPTSSGWPERPDPARRYPGPGRQRGPGPELPARLHQPGGDAVRRQSPYDSQPHYDWVPATGATSGILTLDIAATANCNRCHDPLGIHGGNRREIAYCDTCHNPGSTDANSGNTVDLKVMAHKIHMGANLPSVQAGEPYEIYGYQNSVHNFPT